ncbi:MAG: 16S rRNA (guanine(966)-N(2))-methyltransferase RsmD [Acidobacteriaceae bacterium]|nr:16S rRNA (guanine(966)-N(2))-methyltransferase RsmD [Acidobacteriaceae bacterium]
MRVIAGTLRSRPLKSVPGLTVRPTPDRLREALFNVLAPRIEGATFIDAYAGSGAVGIEAVSRGAGRVILIERSPKALAVIRENLRSLAIESSVTVVRGKAAQLLPNYEVNIVFLDPPYDQVGEYADSLLAISETDCPLAIAQHASHLTLDEQYGPLHKARVLRQGDNSLSFYSR